MTDSQRLAFCSDYRSTWVEYDDRKQLKNKNKNKKITHTYFFYLFTHFIFSINCVYLFIPTQSIIFTEGQIFGILPCFSSSSSYTNLFYFSFNLRPVCIWHFTLCWRRLGVFLEAPTIWRFGSYTEV